MSHQPTDSLLGHPMTIVKRILKADENLSKAVSVCASRSSPLGALRPLLKALEVSFHGVPWLVGSFIAICISHDESSVVIAVNVMVALLLDLLVVALVKATVRRRRPAANYDDMVATVSVDRFSFPSGHTTRAVLMACILCSRACPDSTVVSVAVVTWATATAVSRFVLGRHFVLDVFAGAVIGLALFVVLVRFLWLPADSCFAVSSFARRTVGIS